MTDVWAGVDIGKTDHHCVVIDAERSRLQSRRIANEEAELRPRCAARCRYGFASRYHPTTPLAA